MDNLESLLPIIDRVARDVRYMYGLDEKDAHGVLSLEVVNHAEDYMILHRESRTNLIEIRLKNVAARYARAERVQKSTETKQYFYDPEYIRLFLPFFFAKEDWPSGPIPDDASSKWRTGEAIDTALDIKGAFPRLKDWQANIIVSRHLTEAPTIDGGVHWAKIASVCGLSTEQSAMSRYADATRQLCFEANEFRSRRIDGHEGIGARKVISNATANALLNV